MQRSTVLFLLLGGAAVAVLATIAFSGPGEVVLPPGTGDNTVSDGTANENGSSVLLPTPSVAGGHDGPVPPDAPHVTITVTSKERFVPPPLPPVLATTLAGEELPVEILAGAGSGFDARNGSRGVAMVAIDMPPSRLLRQVALAPQGGQPARIGPRVIVRGSVVDTDKKPVAKAVVWFGELQADGSRREFGVDEAGAFEAEVPSSQGVPMVVRAEGFASKWRTIAVTSDVRPLTTLLQPAAKVQIQLAGRAVAMDQASAFVVTRSKVSSGLSQWPFFVQCLSGGYAISAEGQIEIDDLPQDGVVGVLIRHPFAPLVAPTDIKLGTKLVRATVPMRLGGSLLQGVVVDEQGAGISGASLWVLPKRRRLNEARSQRLLPPHLSDLGACYAQAGPEGLFEIGGIGEDTASLTVRARGHAGRSVPVQAIKSAPVVLPEWRGGDAALRIQPPVAGKVWQLSINLGDGIEEACAADEPFVVSLPHAGAFDVEMVLRVDGKLAGESDVKALLATGLVDLITPAPN